MNVEKNRALVWSFLASAAPLLSVGGEIHVTMKLGKPYDLWCVAQTREHIYTLDH